MMVVPPIIVILLAKSEMVICVLELAKQVAAGVSPALILILQLYNDGIIPPEKVMSSAAPSLNKFVVVKLKV